MPSKEKQAALIVVADKSSTFPATRMKWKAKPSLAKDFMTYVRKAMASRCDGFSPRIYLSIGGSSPSACRS
jgi:hypothetical protein